ncbi:uncharacterized protein [Leptinotarsa decemlineata]|uniref:uncharacterized protein n=1 Tax=Leptinotarsa decemlineata TaxID=7539 RepID=UPI003D308597
MTFIVTFLSVTPITPFHNCSVSYQKFSLNMSQPPPNRFGFQKPNTVTVTSTRTIRIPGTNTTRTEVNTTVTDVSTCPSKKVRQPQVSRIAEPTSFRQQQSIRSVPAPTSVRQPPTSPTSVQASRTLTAPNSFRQPPSGRISAARTSSLQPSRLPQQQRTGIPARASRLPSQIKTSAAAPIPTDAPRTSSIIPGVGASSFLPDVSEVFSSTLKPGQVSPSQRTSKIAKYSMRQQQSKDMNASKLQALQMVPQSMKTTEQTIQQSLLDQSIIKPGENVSAKGKKISKLRPLSFKTPAGNEKVLQKAVSEKRVERDSEGERIVKNVEFSDLNEVTGQMEQVEIGIQQLNPEFKMTEGKDVVGVTSTVVVTPSYTTISKEILRTVTEPLDSGAAMNPALVAQLIEEEKEDVDNTLKMIQPDMVLSPGNYEKKQKLQQLRINPESIALLEESIVYPQPCADEAQAELRPEAMATVMYSVEKGASPDVNPEQLFNSLFKEPSDEQIVQLSSVTPGPLRDVVVPTEKVPQAIHGSIISEDMVKLANRYEDVSENVPYVDIFTKVMEEMKKSPEKGKNKPRSFRPIEDEKSLWVNANMEHLVNVVGAEPVDVLNAADVDELNNSGVLEKEMAEGVDYFLETDPLQYSNRVQLRGSQHPSYFPGYIVVSPELPEMVQVAKSPDEVFATAWKSVQPKYFGDDSLLSRSTLM